MRKSSPGQTLQTPSAGEEGSWESENRSPHNFRYWLQRAHGGEEKFRLFFFFLFSFAKLQISPPNPPACWGQRQGSTDAAAQSPARGVCSPRQAPRGARRPAVVRLKRLLPGSPIPQHQQASRPRRSRRRPYRDFMPADPPRPRSLEWKRGRQRQTKRKSRPTRLIGRGGRRMNTIRSRSCSSSFLSTLTPGPGAAPAPRQRNALFVPSLLALTRVIRPPGKGKDG